MKGKLDSEFEKYGIRKIWRGRLGLSPIEIDLLIGAYYVFEGNFNEISNQLGYNHLTIQKYLQMCNLNSKMNKLRVSEDEHFEIVMQYFVCAGNIREISRRTKHSVDIVNRTLKAEGLSADNYRGYENGLEYLKYHRELRGLSLLQLFEVDQGLYRRLLRERNLKEAVQRKYLKRKR